MTTTKKTTAFASAVIGLLILLLPALAGAQSYTLAPAPFMVFLDNSGRVMNGGCIWTYVAGTTTAATTYADTSGTPNLNPIRSDSAGRFTVYLVAGTSYKFLYESACSPPGHGTVIRTQDNVSGVPAAAATVDVTGTAGETISAGNCVYLSDGSGSKAAGQWFKCDSSTGYSSVLPEIGIAPSAITSGVAGTIRLTGSVTGLSGLSVGSEYFIGSSGALTGTAPANRRHVGHADGSSTLVLTGDPPPPPGNYSACTGRLTLATAVPVTTGDVTAATTLYYTPYTGGICGLYTGAGGWSLRAFAELSISLSGISAQPYDVFLYDNSGTLALELVAWTSDTARATALTTQDGVLVKSGTTTKRYVGTIRGSASNQCEDSFAKRFVWNYYNRVRRPLRVLEATDTWTYTTATLRQANGAAGNQVDVVVGVAETLIAVEAQASAANTNASVAVLVAIGEDSTSAAVSGARITKTNVPLANTVTAFKSDYLGYVPIGRHFYAWLEYSAATGTTTWYGDEGAGSGSPRNGITGWIEG